MAQNESDREDLMQEATALEPRIELRMPGEPEPVVIGRRRDGHYSFYFGPDPVYHFDPQGRLRRAFVGDKLYRTEQTTLAQLTRTRTAAATELERHDLSADELAQFLANMRSRLQRFADEIDAGKGEVLQSIPFNSDFLLELRPVLAHALMADPPLAPSLKR